MSTTWCALRGGPADGDIFPTATEWCTERMVIYRGGHPVKREFDHPAVYLRDDTDQGTYAHVGMDGIKREWPYVGYRFEGVESRDSVWKIEKQRAIEASEEPTP